MTTLNAAPHELALAPIDVIQRSLDRIFGKGAWENYEIETISMELGFVFDELTKDKLSLLQILGGSPEAFYEDVLFFLHATNVINNNIADFDNFPLPSSLEIAYAHTEMVKLYPGKTYSNGVLKTTAYILTLEGYSEPVWPFAEMGVKSEELHKGQEPQDTKNKETAIKKYIEVMNDSDIGSIS